MPYKVAEKNTRWYNRRLLTSGIVALILYILLMLLIGRLLIYHDFGESPTSITELPSTEVIDDRALDESASKFYDELDAYYEYLATTEKYKSKRRK